MKEEAQSLRQRPNPWDPHLGFCAGLLSVGSEREEDSA